jgi:exonuclease SbcC
MTMIHKLHLHNFQSYSDSTIEFDDEVNILSGSSHSGKSALFRALMFLCFNELSGDYFIRNGETKTEVSGWFDDKREGHEDKITKVTRLKSSSKNQYIVEGFDDPITGFRSSVPDIVKDITGFRYAQFSEDLEYAINKDSQHENHFLLQETGGNITDIIGSTTGIHIIDFAVKEANKERKQLERERKSVKEDIDETEEKIEELSYINDVGDEIDDIENKISSLKSKSDRLEDLKSLREDIDSIQSSITDIDNELDNIDVPDVDESIKDDINRLTNLRSIQVEISDLENNISNLDSSLNNYEDISLGIEKNIIDRYYSLVQLKDECVTLNKESNKIDKKISEINNKLESYKDDLHELTDDAICPICNQKIDQDKVINDEY